MKKLVDKGILLIFIILLFGGIGENVAIILVTASAVLCSCTAQYSSESRISLAFEGAFTVLCFINPVFIFGLPLIVYDMFSDRRYILVILSAVPMISRFPEIEYILAAACVAVSAALQIKTQRIELVERKLVGFRDSAEEVQLKLEEKNKDLIAHQDNEIILATLKERNRIARDIHDNVGHMLTRSILQLGALKIVNKDENVEQGLESLSETLNDAMTSIRQSVHDLHDDSVDLYSTVKEIIASVKDKFAVDFEYDISNNPPKDVKFCIIEVIKESLSNAVRHSSGDRVKVVIREHPAFYQLAVEDNGDCCRHIKETGMGLSNMRDRVESIGGIIRYSAGKNGFRVFASIAKNNTEG